MARPGSVLALVSAPAFPPQLRSVTRTSRRPKLTWNEENYVQTAEAVPASYAPLYDFDDSGDTGHYEATADGLHIWTEGTTSEDQVRLLQAVDIPLADVTSAGVDFTNTSGGGVPSPTAHRRPSTSVSSMAPWSLKRSTATSSGSPRVPRTI